MNFGPVPVADAVGAILAHSVRLDGRRLRKGVVLTARDVSALARGGPMEKLIPLIKIRTSLFTPTQVGI